MARSSDSNGYVFSITHQWDGSPIDHVPITLDIRKDPGDDSCIRLQVQAPFFNDPDAPPAKPGEPFDGLWDYEVVEAFFLGDDEKYLEVELCPHGQHLTLMLHGVRKFHKTKLPLDFQSRVNSVEGTWRGLAKIPLEYLPPGMNKFNAYAIHGTGEERIYEALYPVPIDKYTNPDFHRLEYFHNIDVSVLTRHLGQDASLWD